MYLNNWCEVLLPYFRNPSYMHLQHTENWLKARKKRVLWGFAE